jgi:GTPase SAR1 family protein
VILLVDIWHPNLTSEQKKAFSEKLQAQTVVSETPVAPSLPENGSHHAPIGNMEIILTYPRNTGDPKLPPMVKLIQVGDFSVGKASFMFRYVRRIFSDPQQITIALDFMRNYVKIQEQEEETGDTTAVVYPVSLWDFTSGERYQRIHSGYIRRAHGILLEFDLTNRRTFERIRSEYLQENGCLSEWEELFRREQQQEEGNHDEKKNGEKQHEKEKETICSSLPPMILIGMKADLVNERQISFEEAQLLAERSGLEYWECSTRTGEGVDEAVHGLCWKAIHSTPYRMAVENHARQNNNQQNNNNNNGKPESRCTVS